MFHVKKWLLVYACCFATQCFAQVKPIIDNGFLGQQFWATGIHPSGKFIAKADRSVIHVHDRRNGMLFQTYQAPCIVNTIEFSADGRLMFVNTTGEINDYCNRAVVYDFYTGTVLHNQRGRIITSVGPGNTFYIKKENSATEEAYLEIHSCAQPEKPSGYIYCRRTDTVNTVLFDRDHSRELKGAVYPADLRNGKIPADSLPAAWNEKKVKADPSRYIGFEYYVEQTEMPLCSFFDQLSLIVDTLVIVTGKDQLEVYGLYSGRLLTTLENTQYFGYNYVEASHKLCFQESSDYSVQVWLNLRTLEVERKKTQAYYAHHRIVENDSTFYEVRINHHSISVRKSAGDKNPVSTWTQIPHQLDRHDFFFQDSYYGQLLPSKKIVVHNKDKVIDLNDMTLTNVVTFVDTNLLHPAIVEMFPADASVLGINGWLWDMKSPQQFSPMPVHAPGPAIASEIVAGKTPETKHEPWEKYYIASFFPAWNMNAISYPLTRNSFDFDAQRSTDPNQTAFEVYRDGRQLHVLDLATLSKVIIIQSTTAKQLALVEKPFRKFVEEQLSVKNLVQLNPLPEYTLFPFEYEGRYPWHNLYVYNKQQHYEWTYAPVLNTWGKERTTNRQQATDALVRNLFKASLIPVHARGGTAYSVSIINKEEVPQLDYAGIVPENDIYYSDLSFPLVSGQLLSLNYAYGTFSLKKADGSPIVQSSLYRNGEFIHLTPEGYYFASKNKLRRISIRKGNEVYPIEQFDLKYNRPDIVLQRLGCTDQHVLDSYHRAYLKRLKRLGFTEDMLRDDFHLPSIDILNRLNLPTETDSASIELNLELHDERYPLDRINIFINDVPVYGTNGISLRELNTHRHTEKIKLALCQGINRIAVSALNGAGAESYRSNLVIQQRSAPVKPDLYLVSIGTSKYADERYNLSFAAKDAEDIGRVFAANDSGLYAHVHVFTLTNERVNKNSIAQLRDRLAKAGRNDVVMITVAGHGVLDNAFNYYLATYDMDFANPAGRGLPYESLEALLDGIAALKKTILIDACHSGEVDKEEVEALAVNSSTGDGQVKFRTAGAGLQKKNLGLKSTGELMTELFTDLRRGTGATVISSASGVEYAMESSEWQNGLFTWCLLNGIQNQAADLDHNGEIWLSELQQYLSAEVKKRSNGLQQPTSRIENMSMDFRIW